MRFPRSALLALLLGASLPAVAKPVTLGDISLEIPNAFSVKEIERGIQVKSSDDQVLLFIEKYEGKENAALLAEHEAYWKDNGVDAGGDPTTTAGKANDIPYTITKFDKATWKGAPTVVRYLEIGPIGSKDESVLISLWAETADADRAHDGDIGGIVNSVSVKVGQ